MQEEVESGTMFFLLLTRQFGPCRVAGLCVFGGREGDITSQRIDQMAAKYMACLQVGDAQFCRIGQGQAGEFDREVSQAPHHAIVLLCVPKWRQDKVLFDRFGQWSKAILCARDNSLHMLPFLLKRLLKAAKRGVGVSLRSCAQDLNS